MPYSLDQTTRLLNAPIPTALADALIDSVLSRDPTLVPPRAPSTPEACVAMVTSRRASAVEAAVSLLRDPDTLATLLEVDHRSATRKAVAARVDPYDRAAAILVDSLPACTPATAAQVTEALLGGSHRRALELMARFPALAACDQAALVLDVSAHALGYDKSGSTQRTLDLVTRVAPSAPYTGWVKEINWSFLGAEWATPPRLAPFLSVVEAAGPLSWPAQFALYPWAEAHWDEYPDFFESLTARTRALTLLFAALRRPPTPALATLDAQRLLCARLAASSHHQARWIVSEAATHQMSFGADLTRALASAVGDRTNNRTRWHISVDDGGWTALLEDRHHLVTAALDSTDPGPARLARLVDLAELMARAKGSTETDPAITELARSLAITADRWLDASTLAALEKAPLKALELLWEACSPAPIALRDQAATRLPDRFIARLLTHPADPSSLSKEALATLAIWATDHLDDVALFTGQYAEALESRLVPLVPKCTPEDVARFYWEGLIDADHLAGYYSQATPERAQRLIAALSSSAGEWALAPQLDEKLAPIAPWMAVEDLLVFGQEGWNQLVAGLGDLALQPEAFETAVVLAEHWRGTTAELLEVATQLQSGSPAPRAETTAGGPVSTRDTVPVSSAQRG